MCLTQHACWSQLTYVKLKGTFVCKFIQNPTLPCTIYLVKESRGLKLKVDDKALVTPQNYIKVDDKLILKSNHYMIVMYLHVVCLQSVRQ